MKKFTCGHCGGRIAVNPRHLGTLVACPECGKPTHPLAGDILAASKSGPPVRALSAEPVERRCENCGRTIGRLEAVQVWNNHLVCGDCHPKLDRTLPGASGNGKSTGVGASSNGGNAAGGMKALPAPKPTEGVPATGSNGVPNGVPADAALSLSPAKPAGNLPVKRASKPRKGRGAKMLPAPPAAPVPAEGGVTALPSPSSAQAGSNVPTLVMDRPPAGDTAGVGSGWGAGSSGLRGGRASDPLASAGAVAMAAVAAASAVAPIAVKVARVWPWRSKPTPAGRPPEGQFRNRLIGLSLLAILVGAALYGALTLVLAVAGVITQVAIGLLAFGGIIVGLWLAVVTIRKYVPWPPFGRRLVPGDGHAVEGGSANGELARRE